MEFKDLFLKWRQNNGITQQEASELIGISQGSYSRFEKYGIMGIRVADRIQTYYKINKIEFGGEDNDA